MGYGYLVVNDGIMGDSSSPRDLSSFSVTLGCSSTAASLSTSTPPKISANYSKTLKRMASSKNPMKRAKRVVSEYAGCDEASIVRKRAIALASRRISISGEEFRFRLPSIYEVRMSSGGVTSKIQVEASDHVQAERQAQKKFPGSTVLSVNRSEM